LKTEGLYILLPYSVSHFLFLRLRAEKEREDLESYPDAFFDLMRRCLEPNHMTRISASEGLKHKALENVPKVLAQRAKEFEGS
jgi:hypothetical protein